MPKMIGLGLNHGEYNASAALFQDGEIVSAVAEERFNREKVTKSFPKNAVAFCLDYSKIQLADCNFVAQAWNPGASWEKFNPQKVRTNNERDIYFYTVPDNLLNFGNRQDLGDWTSMSFPEKTGLPPVYFVQHHRAHAANAFFLSPFEEAAILTCDWKGEFESTTFGKGSGNNIETFKNIKIPQSLGMFYATFTELLGFSPNNDEWKVMALSAFDVDCDEFYKKIKNTVRFLDGGSIELDQSIYKGVLLDQPKLYTSKLVELVGGREGVSGEESVDWHFSVARAMQRVTEEIAKHFLKHLYDQTKCNNVVLGGGTFMNSVFNGKVTTETPFKNVYISHSPSDIGNSIGAALYVAHCIKGEEKQGLFGSSYLGPEFDDEDIESALVKRKIRYKVLESPEKEAAKLLAEGQIVAVFSGRMEFGERALGNRSVLANPTIAGMKDKINAIIKYRESFRPLAPAVLSEKAHLYFDVPENFECPYMEKVVPVKEKYRNKLPAVTHADGSGRVQTVRRDQNKFFYNTILEFEKLSGYPIVLNTSFNIKGEPIVLSPEDALNTFFKSGLEYLVMGKYLVTKK